MSKCHAVRRDSGLLPLLTLLFLVALLAQAGCGDGVDSALRRDHLHVRDLEVGGGRAAAPGDHLAVEVRCWAYEDGARGRPVEMTDLDPAGFVLGDGAVMPGWDEGLIGTLEGGRRRLIVGPEKITPRFRPTGLAVDEALWCEVLVTAIARIEVTDLGAGDGPAVAAGDYVEISYLGWSLQGGGRDEPFVSSRETDETVGVMLGAGMINRGLELGLEGMRVGGLRQIVVPPTLAYGDAGREAVGPGETVVYEVELVSRVAPDFEVLRAGAGDPVQAGDRLAIHLEGWLVDADGGKTEKFQDSRRLGNTVTVILGDYKIQPGLELGLRGMRPGELRRLRVPAAMAFGRRGWHRGDRTVVPPDADVIYEVEVVGTPTTIR